MSKNYYKAIQKFRTSSENVYFYIISDFMLLSEFEQELCFKRMYVIYLSAIRGLSYEDFKISLISRKGEYKSCVFFIERQYKTDIGYGFSIIDEFFYKEGDYSKENGYMCCWDSGAVLPHFMGRGIGVVYYKICRMLLTTRVQGCNLISFQRLANPLIYEMGHNVGCLVYPGPNECVYPELDKMLRKLMVFFDSEGGTPEKPFVIKRPFRLVGDDSEIYKKMYAKASDHFKFYVDQTELQADSLLICLNIDHLIQGNTLNIPAQKFTVEMIIENDCFIYDPLLNSLFKI